VIFNLTSITLLFNKRSTSILYILPELFLEYLLNALALYHDSPNLSLRVIF